jgi:hypothetical protein
VDEVTKKYGMPVNQVMGKDGFRTADVDAIGAGVGGIRLPPGMKGKQNL